MESCDVKWTFITYCQLITTTKNSNCTQPTCILFTWTYVSLAKEQKLVGAVSDSGVRNGDADAILDCGKRKSTDGLSS